MKPRLLLAVSLSLGLLALYLAGSYPTLSPYRDSGDLAAAALTLGVAHPPGYPVYVLAGKAWLTLLDLGNPAYRLQVLSALLGAAACALLFLSLARSTLAGAAAGFLLLALAPSFRHLSVVSEMYSLNAFMAALLLLLCAEARPKELACASLVLGVGLVNHQTLLAALPLLALAGRREFFGPLDGRRLRLWGACALFFLLGLLLYAYLPLRSRLDPEMNWGRSHESLRNLLRMLTRADYGGVRLHPGRPAGLLSVSGWPQGLLLSLRIFTSEMGLAGILALAWALLSRRSAFALGCAAAFFLSGPLFVVWANLDPSLPETYAILEPHLVLPLVFAASLAAEGFADLLRRGGQGAAVLGARPFSSREEGGPSSSSKAACAAILAAAAGLWMFPRSGAPLWAHRGDFTAWDFGEGLLASLPARSVLVDPDDPTAFILSYLRQAHGRRPDVVPLLYFRTRWGYEQLRQRHPEIFPPWRISSGQELLGTVVSRGLKAGRPFFVDLPQKSPPGTDAFPVGLAYRLHPGTLGAEQSRPALEGSLALSALIRHRGAPAGADFFTAHTDAYWPSALNNLGIEAQRLGLNEEASRIYRKALTLRPLPESWNNWGNASLAMGDTASAEGLYLASARERRTGQVLYNLGRAYFLARRYPEAEASFREALEASDLVDAHNDLGLVLLRTGRAEEAVKEWLGASGKNPAYAPAYYNLGLAFEHLGRMEEARRAVGLYASLSPDPEERRKARLWMERLKKK